MEKKYIFFLCVCVCVLYREYVREYIFFFLICQM